MLLAQVQDSTGQWLCLVSLAVWEHVEWGDRVSVEPANVVIPVPASHTARVEGETYEDISTRRHPSPRPRPEAVFWYVQRIRGARGGLRYVHHSRCWCPGPREAPLDAAAARRALMVPGTFACSACDPESDL